jgi:hypothetical protein
MNLVATCREAQQGQRQVIITKDSVIFDTGAHGATFNQLKWFTELQRLPKPVKFLSATGDTAYAKYFGSVQVELKDTRGSTMFMRLHGVLYYPHSPANLVGNKTILAAGYVWNHENNTLTNKRNGRVCQLNNMEGLPILPSKTNPDLDENIYTPEKAVLASINYDTMHRRLVHANKDAITKACKDAGINLAGPVHHFCEPCTIAKMTDKLPKEAHDVAFRPLDFIRVGLVTLGSPGHLGYKYIVLFVDVVSGYCWVRFIKENGDAYQQVVEFHKWLGTQAGRTIRVLGLDGGTEFGQGLMDFQNGKIFNGQSLRGWKSTKPHLTRHGKTASQSA